MTRPREIQNCFLCGLLSTNLPLLPGENGTPVPAATSEPNSIFDPFVLNDT